MPPNENKQFLEKLMTLAEKDNAILQSLRTRMRWGKLWTFFKVLVIVGAFFFSYYQLGPYFPQIKAIGTQVYNLIFPAEASSQKTETPAVLEAKNLKVTPVPEAVPKVIDDR